MREEKSLEFEVLKGAAARAIAPDLARLRMAVFREWPYLYEGDVAFEEAYLAGYFEEAASVFVVARAGDEVVGLSTGTAMSVELEEVRSVFMESAYRMDEVFYLGESVLLPEWRGKGVGVRFFQERERHAKELGYIWGAFCAVQRSAGDLRKPADYVALDDFWCKRGFTSTSITTKFAWKEVGNGEESAHLMRFWMKRLV